MSPEACADADDRDLHAEVRRLRAALREIADGNPCTCDRAYSDRSLTSPDCQAALAGDDAREALGEPFECRGRKAGKPNPRLVEIMQRKEAGRADPT